MDSLPLKDIHLPEPIGWWPPAPGWWLTPLALLLMTALIYLLYRRLTRKTALKTAKRLLAGLRQQAGERETLATLTDLSAWLRRVAISQDDRQQVAALRGAAWLAYLDRKLTDAPFSTGIGRCLIDAHYRPVVPGNIDLNALFDLCERWLKQQGKRHA